MLLKMFRLIVNEIGLSQNSPVSGNFGILGGHARTQTQKRFLEDFAIGGGFFGLSGTTTLEPLDYSTYRVCDDTHLSQPRGGLRYPRRTDRGFYRRKQAHV